MSPLGKGQSRRCCEGERYSHELHATDPLMQKEPGQQESRGRVEGADHGDDGEIVVTGENDDDYLGGGGDGGNGDGEAGMTPGAKIALGVTAAVVVGGLAYWVGGR